MPRPEININGLFVPPDMDNTSAVSYVLNQTAGKLRIQDIQVRRGSAAKSSAGGEGIARRGSERTGMRGGVWG